MTWRDTCAAPCALLPPTFAPADDRGVGGTLFEAAERDRDHQNYDRERFPAGDTDQRADGVRGPPELLSGYLTLRELAEAFGRVERTILRWVDQPDGLPHLRLGARLWFKRESVERWIAAKETQRNPRGRRRRAA